MSLDRSSLKAAVRQFIGTVLDREELLLVTGGWGDRPHNPLSFEEYTALSERMRDKLRSNDLDGQDGLVRLFLDGHGHKWGLRYPEGSPESLLVRRALFQGLALAAKVLAARADADITGEHDLIGQLDRAFPVPAEAPAAPVAPEPAGIALSELVRRYMDGKVSKLKGRTQTAYREHVGLFLALTGDMPISHLGHEHLRDFRDALVNMPRHRGKKPQFRGKSPRELVILGAGLPAEERISARTVSGVLDNVGAFLGWAENEGYPVQNYAKGKAPAKPSKRASRYAIFEPDDLRRIFHSDLYLRDQYLKGRTRGRLDWRFWMPILGLYTGCRAGELSQLGPADLIESHGTLCLNLTDDGEKSLKTEAARRLVPLHSFLVGPLKFPTYVEKVKARGYDRLFPGLKPTLSAGPSAYLTRWFGKFLDGLGLQEPEGKTFHSWRHTFATAAKMAGCEEVKVAEVVGHATNSMTFGHYGRKYTPDIISRDVIEKLTFDVDLGHLAGCAIIKDL